MSVDLMPNRYAPGATALAERDTALIRRRDGSLGQSYRLQYRTPVHFVRGEGVWLFDPDGNAYLDFYNNVPSLGHGHPEIVDAMCRQASILNVNTRYLDPALVDYAERLLATFAEPLDRVVFTCTGSESNDLALRIARSATRGEGIIVSRHAYHGTSAADAAISPNLGTANQLNPTMRTVDLPQTDGTPATQVADQFTRRVEAAIEDLRQGGVRVAALIFDSIFSSDGVHLDPRGFVSGAVDAVRRAGGLVIADEVQPGFARTGNYAWRGAAGRAAERSTHAVSTRR